MASFVDTGVLKSKRHFEILDGLRGVAAITVVVYHFMEIAVPDLEKNFTSHSYLAVDFFFCLSGFVIAYAYDTRLLQMGMSNFFKLRLIRLHPLVIIGAILGLITFVFDPWADMYGKYGLGKAVLMFLTSCVMIPHANMPERYNNLFLLNPPSWSLMWEYLANIFYALVLVRLSKKWLWILLVIAALCLCYQSLWAHNLMGGWGSNNIWGGGARVFFSFLAGILVYRLNFVINNKLGFIALSLMLLPALLFPYLNNWAWLTDLVSVVVYFPLLIALGAGAQLKDGMKKICKLSGDISYPLYMVHYPFIWLYFSYLAKYKPPMEQIAIIIPMCTLLLIGFAYVVMKLVDEPLRKWLRSKLSKEL